MINTNKNMECNTENFSSTNLHSRSHNKLNMESIKSEYDHRPNTYYIKSRMNDCGIQSKISPLVNTNSQNYLTTPLQQHHTVLNPGLVAEIAEEIERLPHGQEDELYFRNIIPKELDFMNGTFTNGSHEVRESNRGSYDSLSKEISQERYLKPGMHSDESLSKLANQFVDPNVSNDLVSRFKPHHVEIQPAILSSTDTPQSNNFEKFHPIIDRLSSTQHPIKELSPTLNDPHSINNKRNSSAYSSPNTIRTLPGNEVSKQFEERSIPFREHVVEIHDKNERDMTSVAPSSPIEQYFERKRAPPQRHKEPDLEASLPVRPYGSEPSIDIDVQNRSRLYESQMELYVGFIGIQIIVIYANFVFGNYSGGVLSLFTFIAACYSHLDRRSPSYVLTAIVMMIQIIVLCIAVSVGIHGFYSYRDDPTLKAISIGGIPLGIVFIFLNLSLAYQHSYSKESHSSATVVHLKAHH